jgi:hypothetical protein
LKKCSGINPNQIPDFKYKVKLEVFGQCARGDINFLSNVKFGRFSFVKNKFNEV